MTEPMDRVSLPWTMLSAITAEDIPIAMGALALIGILSLLAHLVADVTYAFLDPRIRVQG